ncbi:DNA alkylation repair protein [Neptunicoccus cionae]|uniref:DNA alkylation repair protein n=1 Tax=Neptunicoccus cionae TaxID=2035344 RepID=UPI000C79546A|nr:DNA alkylation repair protein [Amylibacter cionae]PLS22132.1 DNA alkylation repair protein [Amylibacter cionae]
MTPEQALQDIKALEDPQKAAEMAAYHKVERPYLGVSNPQLDALYKDWRKETDIAQRIEIAAYLWDSNIHEARIGAAKLLTQARIKPDQAVWDEICRWVPMFDAWAIADHACGAGARRLFLDDGRLDTVESWTQDENLWVRRAAMVITLPWTKSTHPKPEELAQRERILGWAAGYVNDPEWFIQKSVSWWLRSLSKHDPERVRQFMNDYGAGMKAFARKDATRLL